MVVYIFLWYIASMRSLYHPNREDISLADVLHALSDPIRLRIVWNLASNAEESCGAFGIQIPKSSLSHHFKVLREAGVTRTRTEGTQRLVSLRHKDLDARFPGLLDAVLSAAPFRVKDNAPAHDDSKYPHHEQEHMYEDCL